MRRGMNPNRHAMTEGWGKYVVSAIVHLPNFEGYHKDRFEVVKESLTTMRKNAGLQCQTLIWDNGSCAEFRDWLLNEYKPDFVVLGANVGLSSARAGVLRMLPPNTIVGIADDDMWYYQNWFKAQVDLMRSFPNVGQVSGYPARTQMRWGNRYTKEWARKFARLEEGRFIPDEWDKDFAESVGRDYKWHIGYTKKDNDWRITYQGKQAYAMAHHCQFVCEAGKIAPIIQQNKEAMSSDREFDNAVDVAGMLRLTTINRYVRHMGNVLDDDLKQKPVRTRKK